MPHTLLNACALILLTSSVATAAEPSLRISYHATKTVAFVFAVGVEGATDRVDARLLPTGDGALVVFARVRPGDFDSGHSTRDRHVAELLGDAVTFVSDPIASDRLEASLAGGTTLLRGRLSVGGRVEPVEIPVTFGSDRLEARFTVSLKRFGLEAPRMGPFGGAGRVHDEIQIQVGGAMPPLPTELAGVDR